MIRSVTRFAGLWQEEDGQGLVEYALILVLVSIAAIVALGAIGTNISTILNTISDHLNPVH